jgi:hypothetical protein
MATIRERLARLSVRSGNCWIWRAHRDRHGYPEIKLGGRRGKRVLAHRVSYREHVGPIPDGLEIDHTCSTPACVNPAHLEPVTGEENRRRALARKAAA